MSPGHARTRRCTGPPGPSFQSIQRLRPSPRLKLTVPTLLIYGEEDVRAPRGVAEAIHAAIPGSRLMLVPGAGHDVNLEAPEEYDAAVRAFLRMVDDPAARPACCETVQGVRRRCPGTASP